MADGWIISRDGAGGGEDGGEATRLTPPSVAARVAATATPGLVASTAFISDISGVDTIAGVRTVAVEAVAAAAAAVVVVVAVVAVVAIAVVASMKQGAACSTTGLRAS